VLTSFVERQTDRLAVDGSPFRVFGANCYYLAYLPEDDQRRVFDLAVSFGFNTVRIWAFNDSATQPDGQQVFFRYRAAGAASPTLFEGELGLARLDSAVKLAGEYGVRLILTLANHLKDYGGVPRYMDWLGLPSEESFYWETRARQAFAAWTGELVERTNVLTGTRFTEDPAILAWEIINEPRCPWDPSCVVLTDWIAQMARKIRALVPRQLIACGDEGFFSHARSPSWLFNGSMGVSAEAILGIPEIDFSSAHLYPENWGLAQDPVEFGRMWIREHAAAATRANKPFILGEFGLADKRLRDLAYDAWIEEIDRCGAGALVWMIGLPGWGDEFLLTATSDSPVLAKARIG
jgi:mannan endo-1,4-beta-mannosidase